MNIQTLESKIRKMPTCFLVQEMDFLHDEPDDSFFWTVLHIMQDEVYRRFPSSAE